MKPRYYSIYTYFEYFWFLDTYFIHMHSNYQLTEVGGRTKQWDGTQMCPLFRAWLAYTIYIKCTKANSILVLSAL